MNCLCSLGRWDRGFESHLRHGCFVCVCVYSLLCCPVFRQRPCDGLITHPRSPTVCEKWLRKRIKGQGPEWAGRAVGKKKKISVWFTEHFHCPSRVLSYAYECTEAYAESRKILRCYIKFIGYRIDIISYLNLTWTMITCAIAASHSLGQYEFDSTGNRNIGCHNELSIHSSAWMQKWYMMLSLMLNNRLAFIGLIIVS
jgi:hypothetical protein